MAITKVINDAVDLNQTSDYSGLRLPVGTTGNVVESFTTDYLVVGGGGGGGTAMGASMIGTGAGGGAGGLRTSYGSNSGGGSGAETSLTLTEGVAYDVTVGTGGVKGIYNTSVSTIGNNSVFHTITSDGGGAGGNYNATATVNGGSGGGAAYSGSTGNGTPAQGYGGGSNFQSAYGYGNGGGGGAGAVGGNATSTNSGSGGIGINNSILNSTNASASHIGQVSGGNVYYAGGGGGGVVLGYGTGPGGLGGGGAGGIGVANDGETAPNSTGGGGGGAGKTAASLSPSADGGDGGSGVVILRYPTASVSSFTTTGTLNIPSTTDTLASAAYPATNTAYYKLDGDAADSSGNGNNGAASNVTWANGRFDQAAVFNGSSSYISTGINFSTLPNTKSISMWVKSTGSSSIGFGGMDGSSGNNGLFSFDEAAGDLSYIPKFGGYHNGDASTVVTNAWNHFVVTDTNVNGNVKMYINGSEVTVTKINSTAYTNNTDMQIGRQMRNNGSAFFQTGTIDQIRIFNTALSASNVADLYNEHYQTKFTDGSDTAIVFTEGTGTVAFSGTNPTPPQGALRTNTSYSEDGSASVIEHYNGTDWKYFDAIKYCTTNTLNFPSGAGCIASYNLDNNFDDIGNTYNGINNGVTFNASGKFGAAAVFNGSSSFIQTSLSLDSNNASISFWAKADTLGGTRPIYMINNRNGILVSYAYGSGSNSLTPNTSSQSTLINSTTWTSQYNHIVVNMTGFASSYSLGSPGAAMNIEVFLNGNSIGTTTQTPYGQSDGCRIGRSNGTLYFDGDLDQVRIFNDSLTSDEVSKLYNNEIACS